MGRYFEPEDVIDGFPVTWDPTYKHSDFCPDGERCRINQSNRARYSERSTSPSGKPWNWEALHWSEHLTEVIERHRDHLEYVPDSSRPVEAGGAIQPLKPRLTNTPQARMRKIMEQRAKTAAKVDKIIKRD